MGDDLYSSDTPKRSSASGSQVSSTYESVSSGTGRRRSGALLSSYYDRTLDDTAIDGEDYVYRGDPRVITGGARRRASGRLRRSGSMTDLGGELASNRSSTVTTSYNTPASDEDDSRFFSAGDSSTRSSYYSPTSYTRTGVTTSVPSATLTTTRFTGNTSETQTGASTSYRGTESASLLGDSHNSSGSGTYSSGSPYTYSSTYGSSPYTDTLTVSSGSPSRSALSRAGGVRRRPGHSPSSRSYSSSGSGYTPGSEESSDKENSTDVSGSGPTDDYSHDSFTPSGSYTTLGGSYTSGGTYSGTGTYSDETGVYYFAFFAK